VTADRADEAGYLRLLLARAFVALDPGMASLRKDISAALDARNCSKCGQAMSASVGKYGCPNCHGDGLKIFSYTP
jgi:hypothetical protein